MRRSALMVAAKGCDWWAVEPAPRGPPSARGCVVAWRVLASLDLFGTSPA
jgi:hypothetical protein